MMGLSQMMDDGSQSNDGLWVSVKLYVIDYSQMMDNGPQSNDG